MTSLHQILTEMVRHQASDVHLTVGTAPMFRVHGTVVPSAFEVLTPDTCKALIYSTLKPEQIKGFEKERELDSAFAVQGLGRFRMNVSFQKGMVAAALRHIPEQFLSFETLGLPPAVYSLMKVPKGLILVTGPTGSGKTTTIASMLHYLNHHHHGHIVTIEDPIEFVHQHKNCVVNQREVGVDTESFGQALKHVLRQDPDIILIGEMRDLETIQAAITVAETGHLVFATLHTADAAQSINRMIDVFPAHQQSQVRAQLSFVLQAILSQTLVGRSNGIGRVLACEVLVMTAAVRNLIREGKTEHIPSMIQTGGKVGMQTLNQSLAQLYNKHAITIQQAMENSPDPDELSTMVNRL